MAKILEQSVRYCKECNRETTHVRNGSKISWFMHFFLTLITAGIWLVAFVLMLIWKGLTSDIPGTGGNKGWVCDKCGNGSKK